MAFDFPSSPTNGQSHTENGITYTYDSTYGVWKVNPIPVPDVFSVANAAFGAANSTLVVASAAFNAANNVNLAPPFNVANAAYTTANAGFTVANAALANTTTTLSGDLTISGLSKVQSLYEKTTVSATAATGTINFDALTQSVVFYTTNASGNWTFNVRGNSSVTLNSSLSIGQTLTVAFLAQQGGSAYYPTGFNIYGSSVSPKWQGGTAPSSGNANSIDSYTYTIIKTGSATYTVLSSQTKFA